MSLRALARAERALRGALGLLAAASAVASCALLGRDEQPDNMPQPQAEGGGGGGAQGGTPQPTLPRARKPPFRRGALGTGCSVANDCALGLSCIRGLCEVASFGLLPSEKECVQIDCTTTADCCGGLPVDAPEKCRSRAALCLQKLPGCEPNPCTRSSECAGGGVCTGRCLISSGECSGNVDCLANKCNAGKCTINFTTCSSDADCAANTCGGGSCACDNPAYQPTQPVCTDEDCDGLCLWSCESSRCVIPSACQSDAECFGARPICLAGQCVECADSEDCSFEKSCRSGSCETRCQSDANCALFEACQAGQCIYVGCRSDRECSLIPDVNALQLPAGFDPRLLRCNTVAGVGKCLIPCQTDSQCATTETCSGGLCEYIGCETNGECKTILGVHNQGSSDTQPWIPIVECRATDSSQ
ncbi:MAG TPA: hypothetical protein VGC79_03210 [Polyangiaceae bacterium]